MAQRGALRKVYLTPAERLLVIDLLTGYVRTAGPLPAADGLLAKLEDD